MKPKFTLEDVKVLRIASGEYKNTIEESPWTLEEFDARLSSIANIIETEWLTKDP